jgi:hypothetical protein
MELWSIGVLKGIPDHPITPALQHSMRPTLRGKSLTCRAQTLSCRHVCD